MKFNTKYVPILIFAALALGVVLGGMLNFPNSADYLVKNNSKSKLNKLIDFIDNEYVVFFLISFCKVYFWLLMCFCKDFLMRISKK